jgi:IS30 family transposase
MTLVDRKTRFLVAKKLDDHRAETLKESICTGLKGLPCNTLTVDNGKEFAAHKAITAELKAQVYFAHPHSPWERPTNENTNGLLRQFFPKYKIKQSTCSITVHGNVSIGKLLFRS